FLMYRPYNLIGSRCWNGKANVKLSGALSYGYHAHVQARYGGEQPGQDSPLPSHAFTQDHDPSDIALHRRWREYVMLQLCPKKMLDHLNDVFAIRFAQHQP